MTYITSTFDFKFTILEAQRPNKIKEINSVYFMVLFYLFQPSGTVIKSFPEFVLTDSVIRFWSSIKEKEHKLKRIVFLR